jgi:hypothetical protein
VKLHSMAAMVGTNQATNKQYVNMWKILETYESLVESVSLFEV